MSSNPEGTTTMTRIPLEIVARDRFSDSARPMFHERKTLSIEARMAEIMVEKWGMIASVPDGEDSAGRAKLRLSTPDELATRACDTATAMIAECERRGWLIDVPSMAALQKMHDKDRGRN